MFPNGSGKGRKVESISLGPAGAVIGFRVNRTGSFEVTEFVPNERLTWERDTGVGFRERHFIEVQTTDGGTRITYGYEPLHTWNPFVLPFVLLFQLLSCNLSPLGRWYNGRIMRRLQERLESGS